MRQRWVIAAGIAVLTLIAFGRVATCDFVNYDDPDYVTSNLQVQKGLTAESVKWAFFNLHGVRTYWHPVTWLSHMLDVQLFALNPKAHHLMNLLFHTANVVLLFLLLERLTGELWPSAFAAALFAVHPLQVDSVAWITERKNLLCMLFWLLTIFAYYRYTVCRSFWSYGLTLLMFALGLMCKPVMVTLPFVLLLLDYWPLCRHLDGEKGGENRSGGSLVRNFATIRKLLLEKIPFLVLALVSSVVTIRAHEQLEIPRNVQKLTFDLRLENAFVSYARYLRKFFWPSDLAVLYPHPFRWPPEIIAVSVVLVLGTSAWAIWRARREPYLFVGWFWFLGVLVPAIGLVQVGVQSMADRFVYIPIVGLGAALSWKGSSVWNSFPHLRNAVAMIAVCAIAGFSVLSWRQIGFWKDSEALWTHTLQVEPVNPIAHVDLAAVLVDKGRPSEAIDHYRLAVRYDPFWTDAWALMASTYASQKQYTEAVAAYQRAIELNPQWADLLNNLAWILATCPDAAVRNGTEAIELAQRASAVATNDLPMITGTLAAAYAEAGRFDLAVQTAEKARDLALSAGNNALAAKNEELIILYRARKPYRDQ